MELGFLLIFANSRNMLMGPRSFGGVIVNMQMRVPALRRSAAHRTETEKHTSTADTPTLGGLLWSCRRERSKESASLRVKRSIGRLSHLLLLV